MANGADAHDQSDSGLAGAFGRLVGGVVNPVIEQVDVDDVVERIDVNELVERIDVNALLDRIEPDPLLDRVDPDRVLDRVDANRLLDRVDPDRLLDRVDPNRLLDRVDPDRLLDRVDANRLIDRVDVNALVDRTELRSIIARSTTGVFSELLDVVRTRLMAVDQFVHGVIRRLRGGPKRAVPAGPGGLEVRARDEGETPSFADLAVQLQHRYSGAVSRFVAFLVDQFLASVLYGIGALLLAAALRIIVGYEPDPDEVSVLVALTYGAWWVFYYSVSLAATGKTLGKAMVGVRVVRADGGPLGGRRALLRTVVFPLSFLSFGIGFLIGLFRADRRELHDLLAGSAVVYDWDAETTRLRADADLDGTIGA